MGATKLNGIVLDSFDYDDAGKVVTVFSDKYGKLAFVALGVNKPESKNKYSIITFSRSEFEIFKSRNWDGLSKLKTGNLINTNINISKTYDGYLYASAIAKIVLQATENNQKNYRLYTMIDQALNVISSDESAFTSFFSFMYHSMKFFGGAWSIDRCIRCKQKSKVFRLFSFNEYGMVCPNCIKENEEQQSQHYLNFLQKLDNDTFIETVNSNYETGYIIITTKLLIDYYSNILGITNQPLLDILKKPVFAKDTLENYTHSVLTNSDLWV